MLIDKKDWLKVFHDKGAIWQYEGFGPHAAYEMAATHSNFYFNTDVITDDPVFLKSLCKEKFLPLVSCAPDAVVTYKAKIKALEKIVDALAAELPCKFLSIDLSKTSDLQEMRNKKVVLVTDDIHSGKSLKKLIQVLNAAGAHIQQPILTLANFSGLQDMEGFSIASLIEMSIETFAPADCPLCSQGSPAITARAHWYELKEAKD